VLYELKYTFYVSESVNGTQREWNRYSDFWTSLTGVLRENFVSGDLISKSGRWHSCLVHTKSRVLEKLTHSELFRKFHAFYKTWRFMFRWSRPWNMNQLNVVFSLRFIVILSFHFRLCRYVVFSLRVFLLKFCMCVLYPSWLLHFQYFWYALGRLWGQWFSFHDI
jgi:hypothetical protein